MRVTWNVQRCALRRAASPRVCVCVQPAKSRADRSDLRNEPPLRRRAPHFRRDPKLMPLTPEDDIEHFMTTFERMATVCLWPKEDWAIQLVPLLTGKACNAFVFMDITDSVEYEKAKEAILAKYQITADTYRRRFRSLEIYRGETPPGTDSVGPERQTSRTSGGEMQSWV